MPYTELTLAQMMAVVAKRLGDSGQVFFTTERLRQYSIDALRSWSLTAQWWRARASLVANRSDGLWLDTANFLDESSVAVLPRTTTQQDIVLAVQAYLMEPMNAAVWSATQFSEAQVLAAIEHRLNQLQSETGLVLLESTVAVAAHQQLIDSGMDTLDVRRVSWQPIEGAAYGSRVPLRRLDEQQAAARWTTEVSATPAGYTLATVPAGSMRLWPTPDVGGRLEVLASQARRVLTLSPAAALDIPNDLAPVLQWGVIADLLSGDGEGRDDARARYAEQRYQEGIMLARMLAGVSVAEINGKRAFISAVSDIDRQFLGWPQDTNAPSAVATASHNLLALVPPAPIGEDVSIVVDTWRSAPIPATDGDYVQLGADNFDVVVNYATHLALFPCGGVEFMNSSGRVDDMLRLAVEYNAKLAAQATNFSNLRAKTQQESEVTPRTFSEALASAASGGGQ